MNKLTVAGIIAILLLAGLGVTLSFMNESNDSETNVIKEQVAELEASAKEPMPKKKETNHDLLMDSEELADYLGITLDELNSTDPYDKNTLQIPHMTIDNTIYYSRPAVDKWLLQGFETN